MFKALNPKPQNQASGIAELKQLRRLEDLLVLAAPVSTLSPSDSAEFAQQNLLFNSHRRILVDWLVCITPSPPSSVH